MLQMRLKVRLSLYRRSGHYVFSGVPCRSAAAVTFIATQPRLSLESWRQERNQRSPKLPS